MPSHYLDAEAPAEGDWFRALFEQSPIAVGFARNDVVVGANPAYVRLFGYESAAEILGGSLLDQVAPSHRGHIVEMLARRARGDSPAYRYETRGVRTDGTEFPFEVATTRMVVPNGPLTVAFVIDLSQREETLAALRASEERFRTLTAAAFEGVFVHAEGKIVLANETGAAMYGFDPGSMVGAPVMDLAAPESRALIAERLKSAAAEPYEGVARRRDGSTFLAEVRGRALVHQGRPMRVSVIRDITDRRRIEAEQLVLSERVRQAQKLESLAVLAGGVAHDFNNILTVISNGLALAKREPGIDAACVAHLDVVELAASRAADLCRQMLAYAGKAQIERETVDLSALVAEMSSILETSIARRATLARDLAPDLPTILGDGTQIRQIVLNLVLNASEAMSAHADKAGTVRISTATGTFDANRLARSVAGGEPKAGPYVWLEVEDDGIGMDEATAAQMFDPFFTTKFVGRGLGMAAVLGIVRGHQGAIEVDSRPNRGTRVRVFFPAQKAQPLRASVQPPAKAKGQGLVLLVDDERNVRLSTELLLRELGFDVLVARDGVDAVEIFRLQHPRVDAVLLDMTMPRMNGMDTLRELRRMAPDVPVVITTGFAKLDGVPQPCDEPDGVLTKPYTEERLSWTIQKAIQGRGARSR